MSDASTLKLRLLADSKNPLTFLVGSPFSLHNGCGVPGIDEFVKIAKSFVAAKGTKHLTALNDHLGQSSGSTAYQSTMKWLYDVFTASGVKEVVQKAVLQARLATAPALDPLSGVDGQPTEWQLTPSQTGLARFIKHNPSKFSGNILTTNFDPLMEMALKKEGLTAHTRHFVADGSFETFTPTTGDHQVFHMHGFWRSNDTMHTISQINAKRSHTETSLRSLLDHTDLIVLAYSGWEDILTKVIADRMNDPGFHGTVAWCFHEKSEKDARSKYETVFQRFSGGILQNRISYFYDIDCHTIFDDLVPKDSTPPITAGSVAAPSLTGWQKVTAEYLHSLPELHPDEAIRFFDGANPTLRHAASTLIPRLQLVSAVSESISKGIDKVGACALQLISGATGEGKSTALLQATFDAAKVGLLNVLLRPSTSIPLDPDEVLALDVSKKWLIVADDAKDLTSSLRECAGKLHEAGRHNIFFLFAARDTDWIKAKVGQLGLDGLLEWRPDLKLGRIGEPDALLIVDAWAKQGADGLRGLLSETSSVARAQKLVIACKSQDVRRGDGSFFGAMLDVRFSKSALVDHLVDLLGQLRARPVGSAGKSLFDALVYISNCHSVGVPGLKTSILASALDLGVGNVSGKVAGPLGEELGMSFDGEHYLTRHRRVADAIVIAAFANYSTNLSDVWCELIEHLVKVESTERVGDTFDKILHVSPKIANGLPEAIPLKTRQWIGVDTARAAMKYWPNYLIMVADLGKALRFADNAQEACVEMRKAVTMSQHCWAKDFNKTICGHYYEWSVCAGNVHTRAGDILDAWLGAISISDFFKYSKINSHRSMSSCAGLATVFGRLQNGINGPSYVKGRSAAAYLGLLSLPNERTKPGLLNSRDELTKLGVPKPSSAQEAMVWLADAARAAHEELDDPMLKQKRPSGILTFSMLRRELENGFVS